MKENNKELKSIWGKWWIPIRKWFYPVWLIYETSIRFFNYAQAVHIYFIEQQNYIGKISAQIVAIFCSISTFAICTLFLTLPACFILYHFFKIVNLSNTHFEEKIKNIF